MSLPRLIFALIRWLLGGENLTRGDYVSMISALDRRIDRIDLERHLLLERRVRLVGWRNRFREELRLRRINVKEEIA